MFDLTTQQKTDLAALIGRLEPRKTTLLDPRDAATRGLIELVLEATHKGTDRYPGLHAELDQAANAGPPEDSNLDDVRMIDIGRDSAGRATGRGWHAARGGAFLSGAATLVVDSDSLDMLAFGDTTQVGDTRAPAATVTATAKAGSERLTALTFFHAQRRAEEPARFGVAMDRRALPPGLAKKFPIAITDPVIKRPAHKAIVIALGRDPNHQNKDADYVYPSKTNQAEPLLLVPFVGKATLPYTIANVDAAGHIGGLGITTQLYVSAATAWVTLVDPTTTGKSVIVKPEIDPNTLSWTFPPDGRPQEQTESLRFNPMRQADDTISAFFCQFDVPVENPFVPVYSIAICSMDWPDEPSTECYQISNIQYWWHCIAAGSRVTLADGSTVPIEDVSNEVRVATGIHGASLAVEATTRGMHQDAGGPEGEVHRLVTRKGRELVLTSRHPVITPRGPIMAEDLQPNHPVLTEDGVDHVASCDRIAFDGFFCNLKLGDDDDRAHGKVPEYGSFIANGIVVGDAMTVARQVHANRRNLDHVRAKLPKRHHKDYESALSDMDRRGPPAHAQGWGWGPPANARGG